MYLHRDRETFKDMIEQAADRVGKPSVIVEKDYYVTLILRLLSKQMDQCVFKGGTSHKRELNEKLHKTNGMVCFVQKNF